MESLYQPKYVQGTVTVIFSQKIKDFCHSFGVACVAENSNKVKSKGHSFKLGTLKITNV